MDATDSSKVLLGLLRRRLCLVPTWRGWLVLAVVLALLAVGGARALYPFLALQAPAPGGVLVIEGWAPDWAMEEAVAELKRHHYDKLFVTGTPIEHGAPLSEYRTYAERGAAVLLKLGLDTNLVQAVPAPSVRKDRTAAAALSLKRWLRANGMAPAKVNIITEGPHARRSRLLFQRALGKNVTVGVMTVSARDYDERQWWRYSSGFKGVLGEALSYAYTLVSRQPAE